MIICGDALTELRKLADNSIDSIVTDPPYGLEFMGKEWDKFGISKARAKRLMRDEKPQDEQKYDYLQGKGRYSEMTVKEKNTMQEFFYRWAVEALRVLKPGGHLLSFGGSRTYHRMACAIEDAGFEIRDQIMWITGSGFPKSHNLKGDWHGWGTALKPAHEPICVARKPLSEKTVAENVQKWGTGAINVDGGRIATDELKGKVYRNKGNALTWGGTYGKGTVEGNSKGRWPANIIHNGSDEVVGLFPNVNGVGLYKNETGPGAKFFGGETEKIRRQQWCREKSGSAARFFYCAKASRAEREMGLEGMESKESCYAPMGINDDEGIKARGRNPENQSRKTLNPHPTVKPLALMRYLVRLVTPPHGLVLDLFMGSGTTGIACNAEGFQFIGIDNNPEYCEMAKKRICGELEVRDEKP